MKRLAVPVLVFALGALAYRALVLVAFARPSAQQIESWLFRPTQLPAALVLVIAGWLLWRRREQLRALPSAPHAVQSAVLAIASTGLYAWALLTRTPDLLLASLAAHVLALASIAGGPRGVRTCLLPAAVLLIGVRIPGPLRHEVVWALQRSAAWASHGLLDLIGSDFIREGIVLRDAEHVVHVIDGCSGLQGILTLTLIAILVGELVQLPSRRRWLLAASAPAIGFALNAVRVAYIALYPGAEAALQGGHTLQGVAVLAAGTAILYAVGHLAASPDSDRDIAPPAPAERPTGSQLAGVALIGLAAALSLVLSPFPPRSGVFEPAEIEFPEIRADWSSRPLVAEPYFIGPPAPGERLTRRYERASPTPPPQLIDLLIAMDPERPPDDVGHLFSSQLAWPGPDWEVLHRSRARIWDLDLDAEYSVAWRGSGAERAITYTWRVREGGFWRECWRSLLALEASPFRRERKRAVVQLVAYSVTDRPAEVDRAKQRLDRFITFFRDDLSAL